jgi:hypothetical protein
LAARVGGAGALLGEDAAETLRVTGVVSNGLSVVRIVQANKRV